MDNDIEENISSLTPEQQHRVKNIERWMDEQTSRDITTYLPLEVEHDLDDYTRIVPITVGFDRSKVMGTAYLDPAYLPEGMGYTFAIGGVCLSAIVNEDGVVECQDFDLREISVVLDRDYIQVLKKQGFGK